MDTHILKGTSHIVICYKLTDLEIKGFENFDFDGDRDILKSTMRYTFTIIGGVVSWKSKLYLVVALSTTKTKHVATIEESKEVI